MSKKSIYRNRNATAYFVNLIRISTVRHPKIQNRKKVEVIILFFVAMVTVLEKCSSKYACINAFEHSNVTIISS